jgi:hypothetical protein
MKIHELLVKESEVVVLLDNYDELMAAYERIAPNLGSSARFFAKSTIDSYKKLCKKHPEEQCNRWLADKFLALDTDKREQFADLIAIVDPEAVPREDVQPKTDDKFRAYLASRRAQKQKSEAYTGPDVPPYPGYAGHDDSIELTVDNPFYDPNSDDELAEDPKLDVVVEFNIFGDDITVNRITTIQDEDITHAFDTRHIEQDVVDKLEKQRDYDMRHGSWDESVMDEEPASRDLCLSGKPDSALGASQLASCKSQGYRSRDGGKSHKVGSERVKVRGKKIKGKKYGGPLPDWS